MHIYFAHFDQNLLDIIRLHFVLILILGNKNLKMKICSNPKNVFLNRFVANQPRKLEHILQIKDATKYLYDEIIPEFVKELYTLEQKTKDTKSISIKELMHKRGINLFMMGHIRNLLKPESIFKKILIVEMVSRVSKHQINQILRDKMQQLKLALQQVTFQFFLNHLFLIIKKILLLF